MSSVVGYDADAGILGFTYKICTVIHVGGCRGHFAQAGRPRRRTLQSGAM